MRLAALLLFFATVFAISRVDGYIEQDVDCLSWHLAVETNNVRNWKLVPEECEQYVGHYMLGKQYRKDFKIVANNTIEYAKSLTLVGDGKDIWIFDIDKTTLSNLPYYARSDAIWLILGHYHTMTQSLTSGLWRELCHQYRGLCVYQTLLPLGFKIVFLTGTAERFKYIRIFNLKAAGYHTWEKLILKEEADQGTSALVYKSKKRTELVDSGCRILGNLGDQWSDILGDNSGNRTFKVPDPMYYIG
ncbi:Hypothetical predicted protein [Olea europaea subsp. europaea]|uniref:Acid phosphatase n=1 Tax=Olea europaea subsp. europaea TaxID=158383 RepID=A0A8S0UYU3_OLEEU|nr:Hypothetical predicted protein [Olea europaea subsp. europaea]